MTSTQQAIRDLVRVIRDVTGNLAPMTGIFPDMKAPVVINATPNKTREMMMMRWGFPQPPPKPGDRLS